MAVRAHPGVETFKTKRAEKNTQGVLAPFYFFFLKLGILLVFPPSFLRTSFTGMADNADNSQPSSSATEENVTGENPVAVATPDSEDKSATAAAPDSQVDVDADSAAASSKPEAGDAAEAQEKPAAVAAPAAEASAPPAPPAPPAVVYRNGEYGAVHGFDIGTLNTVCAISKRSDPQSIGLVRNADMMSATPSVISFPSSGHGTRKYGSHADQDRRNNPSNTIDRLG